MNKKIISIGGGGKNILTYLEKNLKRAIDFDFFAINTHKQNDAGLNTILNIHIENAQTKNGTRRNPELGEQIFIANAEMLNNLLKNTDSVILITCLGGGTGSGIIPKFLELITEENIQTNVIVCMPFKFESYTKIANKALKKIRSDDYSLYVLNLEDLYSKRNKNLSLADAFKLVSHNILNIVENDLLIES